MSSPKVVQNSFDHNALDRISNQLDFLQMQVYHSEDFLCSADLSNWFCNHSKIKDKPADSGYYVGYKIAEQYYGNANDKEQANVDIIETNDPLAFLQKSKYAPKE